MKVPQLGINDVLLQAYAQANPALAAHFLNHVPQEMAAIFKQLTAPLLTVARTMGNVAAAAEAGDVPECAAAMRELFGTVEAMNRRFEQEAAQAGMSLAAFMAALTSNNLYAAKGVPPATLPEA